MSIFPTTQKMDSDSKLCQRTTGLCHSTTSQLSEKSIIDPALYQGTTSQAAEKHLLSSKKSEKHTSEAKAPIDSIGFIPGINPRPTARMSFSAACSVMPQAQHIQRRALQFAEKCKQWSKKCQGTTSVVPQMRQNECRALAPEGFFSGFFLKKRLSCATRLVCALTLLLVCLPAHPQTALYRIAGTVVNAATGVPVPRVTIAALSASDHQPVALVVTGDDGRFAVEGLAAAKFELTASRRGFLTAIYDEHEGNYNTAIVTGEGQQTEDLVFRLTPVASLYGVVTGDGGDPVENAKVMLFLKPRSHNPGDRITLKAETTTDDIGAYDFGYLAPGEYFLAVTAQPWFALHPSAPRQRPEAAASTALDMAYPVTFFDSTTEEVSATPIVLAGGSREEANFNLRTVPALHLAVVETPMKQGWIEYRAVLRREIFGAVIPDNRWEVSADPQAGAVEFTGVAPGHYQLSQDNPPRIADLDAIDSQQVDQNLGNLAIQVSGTLQTTSGAVLPDRIFLSLESLDTVHGQEPKNLFSSNGQFTFESIRQGIYELKASSPEKQLSIASISIGGHFQPGNQLTVIDKPMQLVVTVSLSETRIEGFAHKGEKGASGVMLLLVPKDLAAFPALARRDQSDSDGSFALRDAAPGHYTLVAIENGWDLDWERPEVIVRYLPQGIAVNVTETSGKLVRLSQAVPVQSP
jgi:5-hydroxyisourate hydrolase-like protein (transthyretin family)